MRDIASMKTYRIARPVLLFTYTILALMILGGAVFLALFLYTGKPEGLPGLLFAFFWTGALSWTWYAYLRIPVEISIDETSRVHCRSLIKRHSLSVGDILSIKAPMLSPGFVNVRHRGGMIHLMSRMDGFHDLIATLKSINPSIEVKGC
jgi:hypothetical protein